MRTRLGSRRRGRLAALAIVASCAVGGGVVGTMPVTTTESTAIRHAATAVDPAEYYNTAQRKFGAGDVAGGLDAIRQALAVVPNDRDSLTLQAIWADQAGDTTTRDGAIGKLGSAATVARNVIDGVAAAAAIIPDVTPKQRAGRFAVVVLGYGLKADGTMAPELVNRVTAGKAQAETTRTAPVIVTGGVPKKGVTEASAMRKWLTDNGVDATRVTVEDKSGSTVANAQNTATLLRTRNLTDVLLVTSPNHIRRAAADFAGAGLKVAGTLTTATDIDKFLTPLTLDKQKGIRLEATRAASIPTTHQAGLTVPSPLPDTGPGLLTDIGGKIIEGLLGSGSAQGTR